MSVAASLRAFAPLRSRTGIAGASALILVTALSIASYSRGDLTSAVRDAASHGLSDIKTVAAMLADRSPGQRPEGALASLKHKRQPALHERALPKVRAAPPSPYAALAGPPPSPVPPASVVTSPPPLFGMVGAPPVVVPPVNIPGGVGGGGGTPGGPPGFSAIPPPGGGGGGGGGVIVPPPITTTEVPPVTSGVPEPGTWAMMLIGFALIGWALRQDRRSMAESPEG